MKTSSVVALVLVVLLAGPLHGKCVDIAVVQGVQVYIDLRYRRELNLTKDGERGVGGWGGRGRMNTNISECK